MACICPLGIELAPVSAMLDQKHDNLPTIRDQGAYPLGSIGHHNVVPVNDFPSIRFALLVSVRGGIPGEEENDIRLGDVAVSQPTGTFGGVVQYDLGKALTNSQFARVGQLNKPPAVLSASVRKLQAQHLMSGNRISHYLSDMTQRYPLMSRIYSFPSTLPDQLFLTSYTHQPSRTCGECDPVQRVHRAERPDSQPQVHCGTIGSANTVVKDSALRDSLRRDMNILCVEMEAAGLMEAFPCLVIRGICDYADSHKNKEWQPYAVAVAAAYMKELLLEIPSQQVLLQQFAMETMVIDPRAYELLEESNQILRHFLGVSQKQAGELHLRYETERERQCHQAFKRSPYEQFKNNNPDRIDDTCKWVLGHDRFNAWEQKKRHDLLWISADPGCGKSVLLKSLVDIEFHDKENFNVCYFLFKDNGNQDDIATALRAVLHQLFTQKPRLLRHALPVHDKIGVVVRHEIDKLWRILLAATTDPVARPTF